MLYKDFIRHTDSCPFCDKSNNRMLLSTQHAYLTYNIAPYHTHHLLVIPHRHVESLSDLQDEEWIDIVYLQKKSLSILKKLGYTSMSCLVREWNATNKSVPHVHFHTIPEESIGDLDMVAERVVMTPEEIERTIADIQSVCETE